MGTVNLSVTSQRASRLSLWSRLKLAFVQLRNRAISRLELTSLNEHELWDIGMTRSSAEFEATKPFWRE
jgi:uncharacterized protein YjiS (DUF1127 family)